MTRLTVPDMSCAHCTGAIETAIRKVDPGAQVRCDLTTHVVEIDSPAEPATLAEAVRSAGYEVRAAG
ncbi:copper chaperone [Palleronia sediminis]|uniref:Copper chaperone n=1 Tax=Palleronia sediminis TaxID=2547833 RepID=A0A4R6A3C6_9RHOB|nr:heavy-metal-associated domain-containing protein [Palleronia sediminis]TDL78090.1 copper chaperone [Palleronia sediminis]